MPADQVLQARWPWISFFNNVTDQGKKIFFEWDFIKSGKYILFVNDFEDHADWKGTPDNLSKKRDFCTRIIPNCPVQFTKLKRSELTIEKMKLAANFWEHFVYDGCVRSIPVEMRRARPAQAAQAAQTAAGQ